MRKLQEELDAAVAAAYGFNPEDDVLAQLLALNLSMAEQERGGLTDPRPPGGAGLVSNKLTTSFIESPVRL